MADVYKTLGKLAPTDDKEYVLYTSPSNKSAIASSLTVTNRSNTAQKFSLNAYNYAVNQLWLGDFNNFILLSSGSTARYSTNGSAWTNTTMPASSNWISSAFDGTTIVAISTGASLAATSTDGTTWTQRAMPSSRTWIDVTYGNGLFVAIAQNSAVAAYSTDGITWTETALPQSATWSSVTYGAGVFVAVIYNSANTNMGAISTNGVVWNNIVAGSNYLAYNSVSYGGGYFLAVGDLPFIGISTNGTSWNEQSLPSFQSWSSVTYGNGVYIAVAKASSSEFAISTDAITWSVQSAPTSLNWVDIEYSSITQKFYAIASGTPSLMTTSSDGINWSSLSSISSGTITDLNIFTRKYLSPANRRIYQDYEVPANETLILDPGISIASNNSIIAKGTNNITFRLSGVENDEVSKYKLLAQKYAGTYSSSIYSVPGSQAIIRAIIITNTSSSTPDTYSLAISNSPSSGIQNSDKILENIAIMPNETITIKPAYGLENNNTIWVNSTNGSSTTQVFGMEF